MHRLRFALVSKRLVALLHAIISRAVLTHVSRLLHEIRTRRVQWYVTRDTFSLLLFFIARYARCPYRADARTSRFARSRNGARRCRSHCSIPVNVTLLSASRSNVPFPRRESPALPYGTRRTARWGVKFRSHLYTPPPPFTRSFPGNHRIIWERSREESVTRSRD